MEAYHELNGEPVVSSHSLLQSLLRDELGFRGVLVTDWAEIVNLHGFHKVAPALPAARHCPCTPSPITRRRHLTKRRELAPRWRARKKRASSSR